METCEHIQRAFPTYSGKSLGVVIEAKSDAEMLERLAWIMRSGAELRFATDIDDYAAYALARVARSEAFDWTAERAADWLTPWPGWQSTRYEQKALREGRPPGYFTFRRR